MLVTLPNPHLGTPTRLSILKVLQAKERAPTPHFSAVSTLNSYLSL